MALPLEGQMIWVTGSARRIGQEIALELARAGADVIVHGNSSKTEAAEVRDAIAALGRRAIMVLGDHGREEDVRRMIEVIREDAGRLDGLVNNAGTFPSSPFGDTTLPQFEETIRVNLTGPFLCMREALPLLRESGRGHIVNITDATLEGAPQREHAAYMAAKGGLAAMTRALARELAPEIRVNAVAPGPVVAPEDLSKDVAEAILRRVPLGQWGGASSVARAVRFLLESEFITGAAIPVDGGHRLS